MSVGVVVNSPASAPATMNGMISLFRLSFVRLPCGLRSCGMVDLRLPPCLKTQPSYVGGAMPRQGGAFFAYSCLRKIRREKVQGERCRKRLENC